MFQYRGSMLLLSVMLYLGCPLWGEKKSDAGPTQNLPIIMHSFIISLSYIKVLLIHSNV
jgi:hypothetical protein